MSEPPATPDDLATLYLRSRDVPCPGCGYNRRDGITAECPECGNGLGLLSCRPQATLSKAATNWMSAGLLIFSVLGVLYFASAGFDWWRYTWNRHIAITTWGSSAVFWLHVISTGLILPGLIYSMRLAIATFTSRGTSTQRGHFIACACGWIFLAITPVFSYAVWAWIAWLLP